MGSEDNKDKWKRLRSSAMLSSVGFGLVAAIFVGYFIGSWLDGIFGTEPYLMLTLTVLGIAGGFIELFRVVAKWTKP